MYNCCMLTTSLKLNLLVFFLHPELQSFEKIISRLKINIHLKTVPLEPTSNLGYHQLLLTTYQIPFPPFYIVLPVLHSPNQNYPL